MLDLPGADEIEPNVTHLPTLAKISQIESENQLGLKALLPWNLKRLIESEISSGGRFEEFNYPTGALSQFKLVQFSRKIPGNIDCYGLGCATELKSAYLKAFYEFLERKAFFEHGVPLGYQTTNGIAIHKLRPLAARNALAELLERDAFLIHWYGKLPFQPLPYDKWSHLSSFVAQLKEHGYQTVVAQTVYGLRTTLVTFLINSTTSGFVVGTSSGKTLKADIEKSFTEACTNLFLVGPQNDDDSIARLKSSGVKSLRDHREFWLYLAGLPEWALGSASPRVEVTSLDIKPKYQTIAADPLPVVGVKADNILQIRIGPSDKKDNEILTSRLRFLDGKIPSLNDLAIHPIP